MHKIEPYKPEFTFDIYARKEYYKCLEEREAWGDDLITFEQFLSINGEWLYDYYERLLSKQKS